MSTLLALCHRCWTWADAHSQFCAACRAIIDLTESDPTPGDLATLLGTPLLSLGRVKYSPTTWPDEGQLLGTTTGVVFLPELQTGDAWVRAGSTAEPLRMALRARWWSPTPMAPQQVPAVPTAHRVVECWLDSPGSAFLPQRDWRLARWNWTTLKIDRRMGRSFCFRPLDPTAEVRKRWREFLEVTGWS